jgi:hypothetical protein
MWVLGGKLDEWDFVLQECKYKWDAAVQGPQNVNVTGPNKISIHFYGLFYDAITSKGWINDE